MAARYGHPGISRTTDFVERRYWWPNLRKDVADYVRGCGDCQRHKVNNQPTKAPLQPIYPSPEAKPFEVITVDVACVTHASRVRALLCGGQTILRQPSCRWRGKRSRRLPLER
jgi:hypothetical protein